jgi:hypothetical protein
VIERHALDRIVAALTARWAPSATPFLQMAG